MNPQQYRLEDLARLVQGECVGQADLILKGLASLDSAESRHLAFVNGEKYFWPSVVDGDNRFCGGGGGGFFCRLERAVEYFLRVFDFFNPALSGGG